MQGGGIVNGSRIIAAMRGALIIIILALAGTAIGLIAAPRLDPVCVAQTIKHAAQGDRDDWNCLAYAAARGDLRIARSMLSADVRNDSRTGAGATPLIIAAQHGRLAMVDFLLGHGASIDAHTADGATALHRSARYNHAAVVRHLVQAGAAVNARNRRGQTPLIVTSSQDWHGDSEIAHTLVRAGADITISDYHGTTALMAAARAGHTPVVGYLLSAGAQSGRTNKRGATALYMAVRGNHLAAARKLLTHGANPNTTLNSQSALALALSRNYAQMANLLHASGAAHYVAYAARDRLHEGRVLLKQGKPQRAVDAFSAAITLQPDNARGFYLRAVAYARQQKWRAARTDLLLSAKLAPKRTKTLLMLARAYLKTNKPRKAIDTIKQVLALAPDNRQARKLLENTLKQHPQPQRAAPS